MTDALFERKVFVDFSWTGGTKNAAQPKAAFQELKHIQRLFLHVVRIIFPNYTTGDVECFLKKRILSNAKGRANQKGMRVARVKHRKKNTNNFHEAIDRSETSICNTEYSLEPTNITEQQHLRGIDQFRTPSETQNIECKTENERQNSSSFRIGIGSKRKYIN